MSYQINHTKYLSSEELAAFEQLLTRFTHTRDGLLLAVLLHTGARASEALAIRLKDIDKTRDVILIHGIKGSNDREIPLPRALIASLLHFAGQGATQMHGEALNARLFPITYSRLKAIWYEYRPVPKKLHSLRHTFAIVQLKKHGRLDVIKRLLGHKNIQNTMVYADYAYSAEELRKLVVG